MDFGDDGTDDILKLCALRTLCYGHNRPASSASVLRCDSLRPRGAGDPVMMSLHAHIRAGVAQLAERQPSKPLCPSAVLSRVGPRAYRAQLCAVSDSPFRVTTAGSLRASCRPTLRCLCDEVLVRRPRRSRRHRPHGAPERANRGCPQGCQGLRGSRRGAALGAA